MEYHFDAPHPFFGSILVYTLAVLGFNALWNLKRVQEQLTDFQTMINRTGRLPSLTVTLHMAKEAEGTGIAANSVLKNPQEIATAIQESQPLPPIIYADLPPTGTLQTDPSYQLMLVPPTVMTLAAQVAVGSAYESVKDKIEKAYGRNPQEWPKAVEYFRHLRNAAFHGNKFNITPPRGRLTAIDPANPSRWRNSVMPDDNSMNSHHFVEDFILAGDCPILLGDVSDQLKADAVIY